MPKVVPEYKEEAKKKILAAGREVMSRKGYRATTMDDIAEHVGVSKAALYQYFASKDELVVEIVKAFPEQVREKTMAMYPAATPFDAWTAVLDFYLENTEEENALFFELLSLIPRNPEIAESFSGNIQFILSKVTCVMQEEPLCGRLAGRDPRTIALAIMSLFHGLRVLSLIGIERDELRERGIEIGKALFGDAGGVPIMKGRCKNSASVPATPPGTRSESPRKPRRAPDGH
jgi:AcrR family transcriptional regulator